MVIKVYVTNVTSKASLKKEMTHVTDTLTSMGIIIEEVDIALPENDEQKKFMRANSTCRDNENVPMPPQIYNDDDYCGNYDQFYDAVEMNKLYEFLKMADMIQTSTAQLEQQELVSSQDQ